MNHHVISLSRLPMSSDGMMQIAVVIAADQGTATRIQMDDDRSSESILGQLSHVPALVPGDRVVVANSDGGAIVMGKLKAPEHPAAASVTETDDGVTIDAANGIVLKCGEVTIALSGDGKIRLSGDRIITEAAGELLLNGSVVRIN